MSLTSTEIVARCIAALRGWGVAVEHVDRDRYSLIFPGRVAHNFLTFPGERFRAICEIVYAEHAPGGYGSALLSDEIDEVTAEIREMVQ